MSITISKKLQLLKHLQQLANVNTESLLARAVFFSRGMLTAWYAGLRKGVLLNKQFGPAEVILRSALLGPSKKNLSHRKILNTRLSRKRKQRLGPDHWSD